MPATARSSRLQQTRMGIRAAWLMTSVSLTGWVVATTARTPMTKDVFGLNVPPLKKKNKLLKKPNKKLLKKKKVTHTRVGDRNGYYNTLAFSAWYRYIVLWSLYLCTASCTMVIC